jgi:hypothetical protein
MERTKTPTIKDAKAHVKSLGLRLIWSSDWNEFRVIVPGNNAATYYTDDIRDAIGTAEAMAAHLQAATA